jgi:hypothetical protein
MLFIVIFPTIPKAHPIPFENISFVLIQVSMKSPFHNFYTVQTSGVHVSVKNPYTHHVHRFFDTYTYSRAM